jgi:hypothetical protein
MEILVFTAEKTAGLERLIRSSNAIACAGRATPGSERHDLSNLKVPAGAIAGADDWDLFTLDAILATSGLNLNDDYFTPLDLWSARSTPSQKMVNLNHDDAHVIGHIVGCAPVDADFKALAEDTPAEKLPEKLHLKTSAVLYRQWKDSEFQEEMDNIFSEIAEGKYFVSMECAFRNFDYLLQGATGSTEIVGRNSETAFLTKHLKAYGGTGEFKGKKLGRVLRDFVFSGHALTKKPANPDSIIFPADAAKAEVGLAIAKWLNGEDVVLPASKELRGGLNESAWTVRRDIEKFLGSKS